MPKDRAADRLAAYLEMIPENYDRLHEYSIKATNGEMIAVGLVNNKFMSIARTHFTKKGMTSDWHTHTEGETCILQRGAPYYIEIEGMKHCIKVSESRCCFVPPGIAHRLAGTEGESWSIIVLIPGSATFPQEN